MEMRTNPSGWEAPKPPMRIISPETIARQMLDAGPASDTRSKPRLGSLKFNGFTGTGFAHPNPILPPVETRRRTGRMIVPSGSI